MAIRATSSNNRICLDRGVRSIVLIDSLERSGGIDDATGYWLALVAGWAIWDADRRRCWQPKSTALPGAAGRCRRLARADQCLAALDPLVVARLGGRRGKSDAAPGNVSRGRVGRRRDHVRSTACTVPTTASCRISLRQVGRRRAACGPRGEAARHGRRFADRLRLADRRAERDRSRRRTPSS